eukprot:8164-Heterococcus_DN1.PRE.32
MGTLSFDSNTLVEQDRFTAENYLKSSSSVIAKAAYDAIRCSNAATADNVKCYDATPLSNDIASASKIVHPAGAHEVDAAVAVAAVAAATRGNVVAAVAAAAAAATSCVAVVVVVVANGTVAAAAAAAVVPTAAEACMVVAVVTSIAAAT